MREARGALSAYLSGELASPVEVIIPLSAAVILEGLAGGSLDLAFVSATDMIHARRTAGAELLLAGEIGGAMSYKSYWLALADKPYEGVESLRGKRVAFSGRTSTSGYIIPLWDLKRRGLLDSPDPEVFFGAGNVLFGTGYVSAVERVLSGEAEAAAVSDYVFDGGKHLDAAQISRLKKVAEQGPVPTHVIAVRGALDAGLKAKLRAALEALNDGRAVGLGATVFTSRLVPADAEAHLATLAEAVDFAAGVP